MHGKDIAFDALVEKACEISQKHEIDTPNMKRYKAEKAKSMEQRVKNIHIHSLGKCRTSYYGLVVITLSFINSMVMSYDTDTNFTLMTPSFHYSNYSGP